MALKNQSLFLYGIQVTPLNKFIDFKNSIIDDQRTATLTEGFYSLTGILSEVVRAMAVVDTSQGYFVTADRSQSGGTQNRITISTTGAYLKLLFGTGTNTAAGAWSLLGFAQSDYWNATPSYISSASTGTTFLTQYPGYNYLPPERNKQVQGSRTISGSGIKEAVTFQIMQFIDVEFMYETASDIDSYWQDFFDWAIEQKSFDFTPDYTQYNTVHECTLEKTSKANDGLGHDWKEELPSFPGLFSTQKLTFRKVLV